MVTGLIKLKRFLLAIILGDKTKKRHNQLNNKTVSSIIFHIKLPVEQLKEGTVNKIKTPKRQAYGFRNMHYFKLRLYHLHRQGYSLTG